MIPVPPAHFGFWCPGCREVHYVPVSGQEGARTWGMSRDTAGRATLTPSLLVYPRQKFDDDHAPLAQLRVITTPRCHLFVRGGRIEFLSDSTHELAGKTVPCDERTELEP